MGSLQASEFSNLVDEGAIQLDQALTWHLRGNHYPPIHLDFLASAKKAIELANEGDFTTEITLPNGKVKTVGGIIEGLHLDSFVKYEEE